ncbi:MAG TPA: glycosyltransferase family protein [Caulobacteraceae bacterium]|nr:glycosyltransferase family protein [Caulobacteraceae bacterium]
MILAVLQARMSSTRMPGKVMAPVLGEPMIWRQIERMRRARTLSKIVVATSTAASDDALAGFLLGRGCSVYRGDLNDVLARFAACAAAWNPDHVVRLTADCPLIDPQVIDAATALAVSQAADYASNCEQRSYPDGLDVEVISVGALAAAAREATGAFDREHVTPFIRSRPERFRQAHLIQARNLGALRWTVDRPEDFAFVRAVFGKLYPVDPGFGMEEVLELLAERPDLAALAARAQEAAGPVAEPTVIETPAVAA